LTFPEAVERLCEAGMQTMRSDRLPDPRESQDVANKQAIARAIWQASVPIGGSLAEDYLRGCRGISIKLPDCLRFHPALPVGQSGPGRLPALVAAVVDLADTVVAIQRTFLLPDGSGKARIDQAKRALGPVGLGAVCLAGPAPIIGIAEGIETGLSAMELFSVPVWCALGSNLARVALPASTDRIVVFADRGEVGERAATLACTALRLQGRTVAVRYPNAGKDFNDELRRRRNGPQTSTT
jgi:DNA primase